MPASDQAARLLVAVKLATENARKLADVHRVGLIDARRHVGDTPLGAGCADRDSIRHVRDRSGAQRDRIGRRGDRMSTQRHRQRARRIRAVAPLLGDFRPIQ
jgi:hypothetical protein